MRGKGRIGFAGDCNDGITPAYAGKRELLHIVKSPSSDHPRLCGEKRSTGKQPRCTGGSPPPMRGKVAFFNGTYAQLRITPAYAGKSESFNDILYTLRDHPRLCGEKA